MILPAIKEALASDDVETARYALSVLASLGPPAVPMLIDALHHKALRPAVASILGQMGPAAKPAAPALAEVVQQDKSVRARCEALLALGGIGPDAALALSAILDALRDPDEKVCYSACYALGKIGPAASAAKPALQKKLKDTDPTVTLAAAWALAGNRSQMFRDVAGGGSTVDPGPVGPRAEDPPASRDCLAMSWARGQGGRARAAEGDRGQR